MPGGPISSTPFGILPPSFWNFCGSLRKSTISESSSLASSQPATSAKVTFFWFGVRSLAFDLPKAIARFPPACICRMMKIQRPIRNRIGAHCSSIIRMPPSRGSSAVIVTFALRSSGTRSSYGGA